MNRIVFLVLFVTAAVIAGVMFQVKQEVISLEADLGDLNRGIENDKEAIVVLQAEWSFLSRPQRIADLARRHLGMAPLPPQAMAAVTRLAPRPEDFGVLPEVAAATQPMPRRRPGDDAAVVAVVQTADADTGIGRPAGADPIAALIAQQGIGQ